MESKPTILGIDTSAKLYEKLKHDIQLLLADFKDPFASWNFFVTAHHLQHDWGKHDNTSSPLSREKRQKSHLPSEFRLILRELQFIANGSKHHTLTHSMWLGHDSSIHQGLEANWTSWLFHEDMPGTTLKSGQYFSIRLLVVLLEEYFEWVFDESTPLQEFPASIIDILDYNAHRGLRKPPELYFKYCVEAVKTTQQAPDPDPS